MVQELKSKGFELFYFDSKKYGELDFVIKKGMKVGLIEIKSGNDYKKHNALNKVRNVQDWSFGNVTVFCKGNIEVDEVRYLPLYMIMFSKSPKTKNI